MFSSKVSVSLRANNIVARSFRINNQYIRCNEQLQSSCISLEKVSELMKQRSFSNITSLPTTCRFFPIRPFSSEILPKNADVFGDIGNRKFDKVEVDDIEEKVEEFEENEARIPRRLKLSPGQYADLIKSHIENGDLFSAENVLEIVKKNRDKPTLYMYNLIIRAFALHGDIKKCFKLYNNLKKRGLKPNDATITSLFNVCSNSLDDIRSLECLHELRSYLHKKNYVLNETHYNTLVKAYARHKQVDEAFQFLDEMRDKNLPIDEITFNNLLHGATCQKETGIKYALIVWHLMKLRNVKPSLNTYNLLLRVIRDTNLGDLKVNDVLLAESQNSKVQISDGSRPDLLATPPVVRSVPLVSIVHDSKNRNIRDQNTSRRDQNIKIKSEETALSEQNSGPDDLFPQVPLEKIIQKNRLILFGGFEGILKRMEDDQVVPDVKTMTLLMELIPNTKEAEKQVIRHAHNKKISLDIDFYNCLIKRRCFRFDYDDAKAILADIEREGLQPDIFTWGALALACQRPDEGREILACLESIGITPNYFIYGALIRAACDKMEIEYIIELMESMAYKRVKPSNPIYTMLDNFKGKAAEAIREKNQKIKDLPKFQISLTKFKLKYSKWQKKMGRDNIVYRSASAE